MNKGLRGLWSLVLVVVFAGCGGDATEGSGDVRDQRDRDQDTERAAPGGDGIQIEVPDEVPDPTTEETGEPEEPMTDEDSAGEEAEEDTDDDEAAAAIDALTGTKWTHNEIEMEFREGNKVFLKGGPLASIAPAGHEADYTLKDGKLEVDIFNQVHTGAWDGSILTVDGEEAVKME